MDELKQNILSKQVEKEKESARKLFRQRKYMEACMHFMAISSIYRRAAYLYPPEIAENLFLLASGYEALTLNIKDKERGGSVHELVEVESKLGSSLFFPERPPETWDHIGGLEDAKAKLKKFSGSERAFIIYGPRGCGGTLLARAMAHNREIDFYEVQVPTLISGYFGDARKLIDLLFDKSMRSPGAAIYLNGIDVFSKERTSFAQTKGIMLYLMAKIEEVQKMRDVDTYVVASATEPWKMDADIPEHLPVRVRTVLPDDPSRALMFSIHLTGADSSEINMESLVRKTKGFTGRQIAGVCYESLNAMILKQNPGMNEVNVRTLQKDFSVRPLNDEDLTAALAKLEPEAVPEENYRLWCNEYGG